MMEEHLNQECIIYNLNGVPYNEISCLYPFLRPLYTNFELSMKINPVIVHEWMLDKSYIPIGAVLLYGLGIVFGRSYFEKNKPLNWRTALALWNLSLSLFSWIGFSRVFPQVVHNVMTKSLRDNMCHHPEMTCGSSVAGTWILIFVFSKFPELIDTVFIVVHKKPLIFLHWYHHVTVLLFCWHSWVTKSPVGVYFATMNYAVHAIMYGYYFLMAIKAKPKWFNAQWITMAQISQMVVGVVITIISHYYIATDKGTGDDACWISKENTIAASVMYGSYLMLFLQFFFKRYNKKKNKKKNSTATSNGTTTKASGIKQD